MNILITAALSARSHQIQRLLDTDQHQVLLADSGDIPNFMLRAGKILRIPAGDSPVFAHELLKLCMDLQISLVIPVRSKELLPLAKARTLFDEYGIELMVPAIEETENMSVNSSSAAMELRYADQQLQHPDRGVLIKEPDGKYALITAD